MLTRFGITIRKIRLERHLRLREMAELLRLSPAFVSAVETGRKPIPDRYVEAVSRAVAATEVERKELYEAADQTRSTVQVGALKPTERALVAKFARQVHELPPGVMEFLRQELSTYHASENIPRPEKGMNVEPTSSYPSKNRDGPGFGRLPELQVGTPTSYRVPPLSAKKIGENAHRLRALFLNKSQIWFPIVEFLELTLPHIIKGFYIEVRARDEMIEYAKLLIGGESLVIREDVYLNACDGNGHARFTLAHELCHFLLHRFLYASIRAPTYRGSNQHMDSEWQADVFAACLLFDRVHLPLFADSDEAAKRCGMSQQAASIRWSQLRETYELPCPSERTQDAATVSWNGNWNEKKTDLNDDSNFAPAVAWIKNYHTQSIIRKPTCFISYSRHDLAHDRWVEELANHLQGANIDVIFDRWHTFPGGSVSRFVERIEEADCVCVVGTPSYLQKDRDQNRDAIVRAELRLIKARCLSRDEIHQTVKPILVEGTQQTSFPPLLRDSTYIDFTNPKEYFIKLFELLLSIHEISVQNKEAREYLNALRGLSYVRPSRKSGQKTRSVRPGNQYELRFDGTSC